MVRVVVSPGRVGLAEEGSQEVRGGLAEGGSQEVRGGLAEGGSQEVRGGLAEGGSPAVYGGRLPWDEGASCFFSCDASPSSPEKDCKDPLSGVLSAVHGGRSPVGVLGPGPPAPHVS